MKRAGILGVVALAAVATLVAWRPWEVQAQQAGGVQWIWFDEGDPATSAPAGTRYFRKVFEIARGADEGSLDITADDRFTVWINGQKIGTGDDWKKVRAFDIKKHLVEGRNLIAVEAANNDGAAGLLVRVGFIPNGQSKTAVGSDGTWKASKTAAEGWQQLDFDDRQWSSAKVLGPAGQTGMWKNLVWEAGGDERFAVPPGFKVEMVAKNPDPKDPFSLINLCFDAKGRLLVAQEGTRGAYKNSGAVLLCTEPDKDGVFQKVEPYCTQVTNCQGMCWVKDALLVVGNGPDGTGLYRVKDTNGDDKTDEVKLLHKFKGGMGEHGPHAIIHGPDDWLYLVIGNHAWAQPEKLADNSPLRRWPTGNMGPDQGQPNTTEDVLLPRHNDSKGHAANILAPGGTIWRLDHEGKNMSLVAAGFRNEYDAAFSPTGELFTFDSDMEWDVGVPWYRAVRVCHCPAGADFVWRTGAANTPDYYIDSLPPIVETGRGSPVGVEWYDHYEFPEKYRTLFVADWAIGVIYAVHMERNGASYKATAEKFCSGNPMNVTDLAVGPDGALYFTMGGRGTQGGVYRISYQAAKEKEVVSGFRQPFSAFERKSFQELFKFMPKGERQASIDKTHKALADSSLPVDHRLAILPWYLVVGITPPAETVAIITQDQEPEIRAQAIWFIGFASHPKAPELLVKALKDKDALVRRRACEALIRAGIEPPVDAIYPLLDDPDRFARTAARLVIERIDPKKWADRLWKQSSSEEVYQGIVALCKTHQAAAYTEQIFQNLSNGFPKYPYPLMLDYLRTVEMAMVHCPQRPSTVKPIAKFCERQFPHTDYRVNRELAILLTQFRRDGQLTGDVHAKLLKALLDADGNREQQIHFFYCLRLLHDGWTPGQKQQILAWYDSTKTWTGGASFSGFLENMLRDLAPIFTNQERTAVIAQADKMPWAAVGLLRSIPNDQVPDPATLAALYQRLTADKTLPRAAELKEVIVSTLGRSSAEEAQAALRKIADTDQSQRDTVARALAPFPTAANYSYIARGLESGTPLVLVDAIQSLKKSKDKPKAEDAGPYRALLLASSKLQEKDRWKVVELMRQWTGKSFGAEPKDYKDELTAWAKWFGQTFPKEPPLPDVTSDKPVESKYKFDELLTFLEKDPAGLKGDPVRGRKVFEKGQCLKCHKFGTEGEGIGPDLTSLTKRFKRIDTLEAMYYPSKVISDQYRSVVITTLGGQSVTGLAAPQGDLVTVLQNDGTKLTLRKSEIDQQVASLVSVMPEKLLDTLTKEEIADLFAFLEAPPK